jgi:hypothetical protein
MRLVNWSKWPWTVKPGRVEEAGGVHRLKGSGQSVEKSP